MTIFSGRDGTALAYHPSGAGTPVICVPGGPMCASTYLGDLGGLAARHALVLLDPRGTGDSAVPADPDTYRCDRQADDIDALREHLGLDRIDLLGHSAGTNLALAYATRHPERINRLALITPSARAVDLPITDADRRAVAETRRAESWFPDAFAAFERIWAGTATDADWDAITPFTYGRWDTAARVHAATSDATRNDEAAGIFGSAFDPAATRAALATLDVPVLVLAGGSDVSLPPGPAVEYAGLFPHAELVVQPGAGHYPWLDDPAGFVAATAPFFD